MVDRGVLELVHGDGTVRRFGTPTQGFPEVRMRLTDRTAARGIVLDPGLGAAEAFMDGRLVFDRATSSFFST